MLTTMIISRLLSTSVRAHKMRVGDYLARIRYRGSLTPSVETLRSLVWAHKLAVPYTNVEFVNGEKLRLDVDEMYEKIVKNKGGGVCLELNGLFGWLLEKLEFDVTQYNAKFFVESENQFSLWGSHCFPCVSTFHKK